MATKAKKEGLNAPIKQAKTKVSKTWLAFQKMIKNPGVEIVDRRAVLK